jgi:predicted Zn finger-like uncharacterized protein
VKFLCEQCKAKYQIADEKAAGRTVRMKCRKCGHLIEVRATLTDTSTSSGAPEREPVSLPPQAAASLQRPAPPRPAPGASSLASTSKPLHKQERAQAPADALEGAFRSAVQREDDGSAPFDMADLSASDEWYVAINGVPVGPIRVAEIRRKAALRAVTEDSLVWQEGLDEWRQLRSFPELAASVREAMTRAVSRPPGPDGRSSLPPPPAVRGMTRSLLPAGNVARSVPPRAPPPSANAQRSNVVPIMSRLATAERLDESVPDRSSPLPGTPLAAPRPVTPSVVPDPFADGAASVREHNTAAVAQPPAASASAQVSLVPPAKKSPPWMAIGMVVMFGAFGVTAAVLLVRPSPPTPASAATAQSGAAPASVAPTATGVTTLAPIETSDPGPSPAPTIAKTPASTGAPKPTASAASSSGRALDLRSLTQNGPSIRPTDDPSMEAPKTPGQGVSAGQVQQVIALHRTAIGRMCWERNPTTKGAVNVSVTMTVGPDGSAQNVSASGDEPSVAKCIENDVRGWRFPATGTPQEINFSLKFVRQ